MQVTRGAASYDKSYGNFSCGTLMPKDYVSLEKGVNIFGVNPENWNCVVGLYLLSGISICIC